jgi:hypothetical protein
VKCFGLEKSSKRVKLDDEAVREAQLYRRLPDLWVCIAVFDVESLVPVAQMGHAGSLRDRRGSSDRPWPALASWRRIEKRSCADVREAYHSRRRGDAVIKAYINYPHCYTELHAVWTCSTGKALDTRLQRLGKPHLLKIYPPIGKTADDGHAFPILGMSIWEPDVFAFLDEHMRR